MKLLTKQHKYSKYISLKVITNKQKMLSIKNLHASIGDKEILKE
jgi:hypothetical protein